MDNLKFYISNKLELPYDIETDTLAGIKVKENIEELTRKLDNYNYSFIDYMFYKTYNIEEPIIPKYETLEELCTFLGYRTLSCFTAGEELKLFVQTSRNQMENIKYIYENVDNRLYLLKFTELLVWSSLINIQELKEITQDPIIINRANQEMQEFKQIIQE